MQAATKSSVDQGAPSTVTDHVQSESTSKWNGPFAPFSGSFVVPESVAPNSLTSWSDRAGLPSVP